MKKKQISINKFEIFNEDIMSSGSYIYTKKEIFSARLVHKRITKENVDLLKKHFSNKIRILDVGCGDGTCSLELLSLFKPTKILGFDAAGEAIKYAKSIIKNNQANKIFFQKCNIYNINKIIKKNDYDLAIIRSVLHHLDNPQLAIDNVCKLVNKIIVLDPNGYNPILKIIEKTSHYHRQHAEKSYFPYQIDDWFLNNDFTLKTRKIFNIIPYFCDKHFALFLKKLEPFFENIPIIKNFCCSQNLSFYEKV